jgi:hypothetical protein
VQKSGEEGKKIPKIVIFLSYTVIWDKKQMDTLDKIKRFKDDSEDRDFCELF